MVFVAARDDTLGDPSVSGDGVTYALEASVANTQTQFKIWLFSGQESTTPTGGAITVTLSGNLDPVACIATRWNAVDTTDAIEANGTDAGPNPDDDDMLMSLTTLTNDAVHLGFGSHRNKTFTVPGTETSLSINNSYGSGGDVASASAWYETVATASSNQIGDTADLNADIDWAIISVSLKPSGAGGLAWNEEGILRGVGRGIGRGI